MIDFPFFHGGSSHYRHLLEIGSPVRPWPHKNDALELMRSVWAELRKRGREPDWYRTRMMEQHSGYANWQHGETYVTPSRKKAAGYAASNGKHGGELLNECAEAIVQLEQIDGEAAEQMRARYPKLDSMLAGGGSPLLIRIEGVRIEDLTSETSPGAAIERSLEETLAEIEGFKGNANLFEVVGSIGFRLRPGAGVVVAIEDL